MRQGSQRFGGEEALARDRVTEQAVEALAERATYKTTTAWAAGNLRRAWRNRDFGTLRRLAAELNDTALMRDLEQYE